MEKHTDTRGWPLKLIGAFERPTSEISTPISVIGISLFVLLVVVGFLAVGWLLVDLLSGDQKRAADAAKAALPVLAGAVGLPLIVWRLLILDRQTRISEAKTDIDRETHYTSIFSRAIEQLGQTRELKRTVDSEEGSSTTTATAPNIEVRLGGIHSLSRLADESVRDQSTIENVLRSYIRENSWSDRLGRPHERSPWSRRRTSWVIGLSDDYQDKEANAEIRKWIEETDAKIKQNSRWANSLPETRVDVNEAADGLEIQTSKRPPSPTSLLYECLFVGRHFSSKFLAHIRFRRCTFIRCTFDTNDASGISLIDSNIIDCVFTGSPLQLSIHNSTLGNTRFKRCLKSDISLTDCDAYQLVFEDPPSNLNADGSILYSFRLPSRYIREETPTITLSLAGTILLRAELKNMKLSAKSNLRVMANPDTEIRDINLEDVTDFYPDDLRGLKANQRSVHPKNADRPPTWPPLDLLGQDIDDDIPF